MQGGQSFPMSLSSMNLFPDHRASPQNLSPNFVIFFFFIDEHIPLDAPENRVLSLGTLCVCVCVHPTTTNVRPLCSSPALLLFSQRTESSKLALSLNYAFECSLTKHPPRLLSITTATAAAGLIAK